MDTNRKKNSFINRIDDVELDLIKKDTDYAKQYLIEEGFNIDEELEFANVYMKKIHFLAKAVSNKKKDEKIFEEAYLKVKEAIKENAKKTTQILISMLQSKTPSVQYRKLENWTDDEIRDVLTDVDLVKLMEEIDLKGKYDL